MFYGGASRLEAAAAVPSGSADISVALSRGATLAGRITAADSGAPLEHVAVTLYAAGDRVTETRLTGFDGRYSFSGTLPSGPYRIGAAPGRSADGTPYFTNYRAVFSGGASSLAEAQPIAVLAPRTFSVDLAMPPAQARTPTPSPGERQVRLPLVVR